MADPTLAEVARSVADARTALDLAWTVLAGSLVMFMQAGFALVVAGLTRRKNVAHTMGMSFFAFAIGILGFSLVGFGLQAGATGGTGEFTLRLLGKDLGLFGTSGFMLAPEALTPAVAATFLSQVVFLVAACTIPTGALAERWKFTSFVLFSFVVATVIYPVYANWVWGGGWLSQLGSHFGLGHGHVDFAGASVVHLTGGVIAFFAARQLGPRIGKYTSDGRINPIPPHDVAQVMTGTFILAFGWLAFTAGSTLSGRDTQLAVAATNAVLASASGAFTAFLSTRLTWGKPDPSWLANGLLAGLVAITAPCAFVDAPVALLIGAVAGVLVVVAAVFVDTRLKIDDPVGAIAVHGVNGAFGVVALGLFANGRHGEGWNGVAGKVTGLFYGDPGQLVAGLIGLAANVAWVGLVASVAFFAVGALVGNRVSAEDEIGGLDLPEMGVLGYSDEPGPASGIAGQAPVPARARVPRLAPTGK